MNQSKRYLGNFRILRLTLAIGLALFAAGCGNKTATFSLLSDVNNFQQNTAKLNGKIDILWVIDNSNSMKSSQDNIAENFERFIDQFNKKGFDYRMAVTTTDAYKDLYGKPADFSRFRDGTDLTGHTGYFIVTPSTPNAKAVFLQNMIQGVGGAADERAFQSMERTLINPLNAGFPRPDAYFSVIIVSDEDDFSYDGSATIGGQYSNPSLHTVDRYISFLDNVTSVVDGNRAARYNVNSIAILDQTCLDELNAKISGRKIGKRYVELSGKTEGIIGSLCGDFGTTLSDISTKIIELSTQFYLNREPVPETLNVIVDGELVPRLAGTEPLPWNGYIYHADTNSLTFHGSGVPGAGASIAVLFDPKTLK